jgi:hypothetical protein
MDEATECHMVTDESYCNAEPLSSKFVVAQVDSGHRPNYKMTTIAAKLGFAWQRLRLM